MKKLILGTKEIKGKTWCYISIKYKRAACHIPQLYFKITLHQKVQAAYRSFQIKHN